MNKKFFKKAIKVIAIIGAYLISMIGSAIIGSAIALAAEEKVKRELKTVKTEVKETEVKTERSNERVIIKGFTGGTEH